MKGFSFGKSRNNTEDRKKSGFGDFMIRGFGSRPHHTRNIHPKRHPDLVWGKWFNRHIAAEEQDKRDIVAEEQEKSAQKITKKPEKPKRVLGKWFNRDITAEEQDKYDTAAKEQDKRDIAIEEQEKSVQKITKKPEKPKHKKSEENKSEQNKVKSYDTISGNYILTRGWEDNNMSVFRTRRR